MTTPSSTCVGCKYNFKDPRDPSGHCYMFVVKPLQCHQHIPDPMEYDIEDDAWDGDDGDDEWDRGNNIYGDARDDDLGDDPCHPLHCGPHCGNWGGDGICTLETLGWRER